MPRSDYAHWNEEQDRVWWEEEGKHAESDGEAWAAENDEAADAFFEEHADTPTDDLKTMLADEGYCERWPQAARCIRWILENRGER